MVASPVTAILVVALLAYLALPGTFLFDDHSLFAGGVEAGPWLQPRPVTYLAFALDQALWGRQPAGFRLTNLLIHLAAAAMVFRAARRFVPPAAAAFAAAAFALHPANAEPVFYVFARGSSLATLLCLISFELWERGRRWAASAVFVVALGAKEECVAFPLFLALLEWARRRPVPVAPLSVMTATCLAAGVRVIWATRQIAGSGSGFGQSTTPWEYFSHQAGALAVYTGQLLAPFAISIDPASPPEWLWLWAGWLAVAAAALYFRPAPDRPAFWFAAALLLILPSSSIFPAADAIAFRRLYLPMAALSIGAAMTIPKRLQPVVLVLLGAAAVAGREQWSTEAGAWRHAHRLAPDKLRPVVQLARAVPAPEALAILEAAKKKNPRSAEVASHLGRVHLEQSRPELALAEFGRALALEPGVARHILNRGVALSLLNQTDAALADFESALAKDPCLGAARLNLERHGRKPTQICTSMSSGAK